MFGKMMIGSLIGAVIGSFFLVPFGTFAGSFIGGAIAALVSAHQADAKREVISKINPHGSATEVASKLQDAGLTEIEFRQCVESRDGRQTITDDRLRRVSRR